MASVYPLELPNHSLMNVSLRSPMAIKFNFYMTIGTNNTEIYVVKTDKIYHKFVYRCDKLL